MKLKINDKIQEVTAKIDGGTIYVEINGKKKSYDIIDESAAILKQKNRIVKSDYFIGKETMIWIDGEEYYISEIKKEREAKKSKSGKKTSIDSPLPGVITKIAVSPGDQLEEGDLILVIESMKMANEIKAEFSGTIKTILVKEGDQVAMSDKLILF
ncbi:MAG TPA: biotin/lipoyl-binding protein [Deltaproteobacteria bacterium]|nr:MAG: acetyl-CoA carboxylase biotin carboxyl carrier protein subunit [bacterium]HDH10271.1 biotin/lipoyl-binding protein [Deltaproteobacteria bacterium]